MILRPEHINMDIFLTASGFIAAVPAGHKPKLVLNLHRVREKLHWADIQALISWQRHTRKESGAVIALAELRYKQNLIATVKLIIAFQDFHQSEEEAIKIVSRQ